MARRRQRRAAEHFVAVRANHYRPCVIGAAQDHQRAHIVFSGYSAAADKGRKNMPTFEDREKEFENWFKHEQEMRFKAVARRNYMLGVWAAERMGLSGPAVDDYAKAVVNAEFEKGGDKHVVEKVVADLTAKGQSVTADQVRFELDHFAAQARQQLMRE